MALSCPQSFNGPSVPVRHTPSSLGWHIRASTIGPLFHQPHFLSLSCILHSSLYPHHNVRILQSQSFWSPWPGMPFSPPLHLLSLTPLPYFPCPSGTIALYLANSCSFWKVPQSTLTPLSSHRQLDWVTTDSWIGHPVSGPPRWLVLVHLCVSLRRLWDRWNIILNWLLLMFYSFMFL